jgi:hypothetical protein
MRGKRYNYMALPFTILPESCKFSSSAPASLPDKIFCSQMGLMLCYLCGIIRPEYHYHGHSVVFDPACCTPADLHRLLLASSNAQLCAAEHIRIIDDTSAEEAAIY